eukprot:SM000010S04246  [mRNA]  locus=s10:567736:572220:+ [translate_table: standard]
MAALVACPPAAALVAAAGASSGASCSGRSTPPAVARLRSLAPGAVAKRCSTVNDSQHFSAPPCAAATRPLRCAAGQEKAGLRVRTVTGLAVAGTAPLDGSCTASSPSSRHSTACAASGTGRLEERRAAGSGPTLSAAANGRVAGSHTRSRATSNGAAVSTSQRIFVDNSSSSASPSEDAVNGRLGNMSDPSAALEPASKYLEGAEHSMSRGSSGATVAWEEGDSALGTGVVVGEEDWEGEEDANEEPLGFHPLKDIDYERIARKNVRRVAAAFVASRRFAKRAGGAIGDSLAAAKLSARKAWGGPELAPGPERDAFVKAVADAGKRLDEVHSSGTQTATTTVEASESEAQGDVGDGIDDPWDIVKRWWNNPAFVRCRVSLSMANLTMAIPTFVGRVLPLLQTSFQFPFKEISLPILAPLLFGGGIVFKSVISNLGYVLPRLAMAAAILWLLWGINNVMTEAITHLRNHGAVDRNVSSFLILCLELTSSAIAVVTVLSSVGVKVASLLLPSLVIAALAGKDVWYNYFAGFFLFAAQPFRPGDTVAVLLGQSQLGPPSMSPASHVHLGTGWFEGMCESVSLRYTVLRNGRHRLMVPNSVFVRREFVLTDTSPIVKVYSHKRKARQEHSEGQGAASSLFEGSLAFHKANQRGHQRTQD